MTTPQPQHTNRLIHASSPYLLQHAHNPVDWYEWGAEALEKAAREDKPIFLSIGYSACHWCHVMEHECFENEDIARLLNEHFVSIKVDREERPDLDEVYMQVTMMMNDGRGGWPMSLFLTPERLPIFAGTYFPPDRFRTLCERVAEAWEQRRPELETTAGQVRRALEAWAQGASEPGDVPPAEIIPQAARLLARYFDPVHGGIGQGNKFPPHLAMELMLRVCVRTGNAALLEPVTRTLDHMANGGIYDHLGGGIFRYAVTPDWLVPHFEKMLYDQALVSSILLDACQATHNPLYARRAGEILDYCLRDLRSPEGGFYSTRDADSEGQEGKYYIWTVEQVRDVLGEKDARLFETYYDVTATGNWDERFGHAPPGPKNILHISEDAAAVAQRFGLAPEAFLERMAASRAKLLAARQRRVPPALDDKCLAAWNGLMIAALAKGACVLEEPRYAEVAAAAADFVLTRMRKDGRLFRTYRKGQARLTAYLNDYAFMIEGLLNLYEATFDRRWLTEALALNDVLLREYADPEGGGFFFTAADADPLVVRTKPAHDGAIPSGNAVQADNLLRLAALTGRAELRERAAAIFRAFGGEITSSPAAHERLLGALDRFHRGDLEIAIIGEPEAPDVRALLHAIRQRFLLNKVVVLGAGDDNGAQPASLLPLLRRRTKVNGRATAYVCRGRTCYPPVTTPAELDRTFRLLSC